MTGKAGGGPVVYGPWMTPLFSFVKEPLERGGGRVRLVKNLKLTGNKIDPCVGKCGGHKSGGL